ncbi:disheveled-associated activator of morphogenesis 2 [Plakobranchus ocellatus]|uniref:Disheveled-associated activator of morphogenesis 2 n=1 Tax=Plakobranchus ocellatus TaxID=259542 RepID=A0AAV3Y1A2_9GAST|nr:disheveled-associated activator of morphogenesis 2 [Plakobranchus ocellatus]
MPARGGLCWCLGGSPRPPEIKHGLDYATPLQTMSPDTPMPTDENELNSKFEELVAELGLDKAHRDALYNLPAEKKWQIYCSKKTVSTLSRLLLLRQHHWVGDVRFSGTVMPQDQEARGQITPEWFVSGSVMCSLVEYFHLAYVCIASSTPATFLPRAG